MQSLVKLESTFALLVSPHERTAECRRHGATLHADMGRLHQRQRDQLAANLRDVFHEPLQEICKARGPFTHFQLRISYQAHAFAPFLSPPSRRQAHGFCRVVQVVVEAQCRQYWSVSTLRHFVHRECGKWVRRSTLGSSLTEPTLHSVLNLFLDKDVGACVEEVKLQEALYNTQWRRFVAVAGLLGLAVAIVYMGAKSKIE